MALFNSFRVSLLLETATQRFLPGTRRGQPCATPPPHTTVASTCTQGPCSPSSSTPRAPPCWNVTCPAAPAFLCRRRLRGRPHLGLARRPLRLPPDPVRAGASRRLCGGGPREAHKVLGPGRLGATKASAGCAKPGSPRETVSPLVTTTHTIQNSVFRARFSLDLQIL
jgi:hypothetical protein